MPMNRSQKLFAFLVLLFALFLIGMVIDISRKTTFPGKRNKAKQAILALPPCHWSAGLATQHLLGQLVDRALGTPGRAPTFES